MMLFCSGLRPYAQMQRGPEAIRGVIFKLC
jgi:hypothetical protein